MSQVEHLVKMANQIAENFAAAASEDDAVEQTAQHMRRFWTAAMRGKLLDHASRGCAGCSPLVRRMLSEQLQ